MSNLNNLFPFIYLCLLLFNSLSLKKNINILPSLLSHKQLSCCWLIYHLKSPKSISRYLIFFRRGIGIFFIGMFTLVCPLALFFLNNNLIFSLSIQITRNLKYLYFT